MHKQDFILLFKARQWAGTQTGHQLEEAIWKPDTLLSPYTIKRRYTFSKRHSGWNWHIILCKENELWRHSGRDAARYTFIRRRFRSTCSSEQVSVFRGTEGWSKGKISLKKSAQSLTGWAHTLTDHCLHRAHFSWVIIFRVAANIRNNNKLYLQECSVAKDRVIYRSVRMKWICLQRIYSGTRPMELHHFGGLSLWTGTNLWLILFSLWKFIFNIYSIEILKKDYTCMVSELINRII